MISEDQRPRLAEIRAKLIERRKGACETPPCEDYVSKTPEDYGYASCARCGWSEPEHVIDQLADLLASSESVRGQLEQEMNAGLPGTPGHAEPDALRLQPQPDNVERCNRCGGPYRFDISVPSDVWNHVIRPNGEVPDMLCGTCIIAAFVRAGVGFTATLWGDGFDGEEMSLQPCSLERWRKVSGWCDVHKFGSNVGPCPWCQPSSDVAAANVVAEDLPVDPDLKVHTRPGSGVSERRIDDKDAGSLRSYGQGQSVGPEASSLQLAIAERIAREAHKDQKCTVTGEPYIRHVERVVAMVEGEEAKAVAWLHDVLEDSDFTEGELRRAGISDAVLTAVEILTKPDNETSMVVHTYAQYINRIRASGNALALGVKLADLRDHLRPDCPQRLYVRYVAAWKALTGQPPPGEAQSAANQVGKIEPGNSQ